MCIKHPYLSCSPHWLRTTSATQCRILPPPSPGEKETIVTGHLTFIFSHLHSPSASISMSSQFLLTSTSPTGFPSSIYLLTFPFPIAVIFHSCVVFRLTWFELRYWSLVISSDSDHAVCRERQRETQSVDSPKKLRSWINWITRDRTRVIYSVTERQQRSFDMLCPLTGLPMQ